MTFDLSGPHRRVEINKKIYWKREPYDPDDPGGSYLYLQR